MESIKLTLIQSLAFRSLIDREQRINEMQKSHNADVDMVVAEVESTNGIQAGSIKSGKWRINISEGVLEVNPELAAINSPGGGFN